MNRTVLLTGYFGKHPDARPGVYPRITVPRYSTIAEVAEASTASAGYHDGMVLPLYTRLDRELQQHWLVVLPRDQRRLRFPRRGDRIEVEGRPEIFRYRDHDGVLREAHQVIVERLRVIERAAGLGRQVILTGYLGSDPEVRLTGERTLVSSWYNPIAEMDEPPREVRTRAREYLLLALYPHDGRTRRHQLVVWSADRLCHRNIRLLRKGDRVKVLGRQDVFRFDAGDGTLRERPQVIVERMRLLERRRRAPEIA